MRGMKVEEEGHDRVPFLLKNMFNGKIFIVNSIVSSYNSYWCDINIDNEDIKMVPYIWRWDYVEILLIRELWI